MRAAFAPSSRFVSRLTRLARLAAVEHLRTLLTNRATFLSQLSSLHAAAAAQGIAISAPTADGYGRDWEQKWDEGMREELGFARDADGVKREDVEEEEEWEDDG